jgi:hypothetical protein
MHAAVLVANRDPFAEHMGKFCLTAARATIPEQIFILLFLFIFLLSNGLVLALWFNNFPSSVSKSGPVQTGKFKQESQTRGARSG